MMYDIFQLVVLLANVAAMGYYCYLSGKAKGVLKAIETVLAQREEEEKIKPALNNAPKNHYERTSIV